VKTRIIAFALAAIVALSIFSGCTGTDSPDTGSSTKPLSTYRAFLVSASEDEPNSGLSSKHDIISFEHTLGKLKTPEGSDIQEIIRMHDVKDENELETGIKNAFAEASDDDVNIFFFSGHGVSYSEFGDTHIQLGYENPIMYSAEQLYAILSQIPGNHLVIISACMSGGFKDVLVGERFFVITASSALQLTHSYGQAEDFETNTHSFLVIGLCEGLGMRLSEQNGAWTYESPPASRVAADNNNDGIVSFDELRQYLRNHWQITSIVQTYPENSDFSLFSYTDPERSPAIYGISFTRPSTTAFALEFAMNKIADRVYAEADYPDASTQDDWGYGFFTAPLDIVLLGNDRYRIEWDSSGKRVINQADVVLRIMQSEYEIFLRYNILFSEPAAAPEIALLDSDFQPDVIRPDGQEYRVVVSHNLDCLLDVYIYNGSTLVRTLAKGDAARRIVLANWGYADSLYNVYYWDGKDDSGKFAPDGNGYEVRVRAYNTFGEVVHTKALPQVKEL